MKSKILALLLLAGAMCFAEQIPNGTRDGQIHVLDDGSFLAWDVPSAQWVSPDAFWKVYADRASGRNWGSGSEFPPYEEVNEHDTFLVQLESGTCLMYFFHTRWRRANDVRRWGDEFNEYSACPYVFD